jgi:C-terminal processing protease CtpA/Prc
MTRRGAASLITTLALFLFSANLAAADQGWFGLGFSADIEGLFTPTLRSITITKVLPSSPAALAGIAPGDTVLEVQGIVVAGTKPDVFKAAMQKSVGETLRLKIKRGATEIREVSMVALKKPQEQ